MNSVDYSLYDEDYQVPKEQVKPNKEVKKKEKSSKENIVDYSLYDDSLTEKQQENEKPEDEGFWDTAFRTAAQIPIGLAEGSTYGLLTNLSNLLAMGDVNDPEEMERIKAIAEREGIPFDEEKFKKAGQQALSSFPTPGNIATMTEEATGLPLEAKTKLQKSLRLGSTAGRIVPGNIAEKATAAITAPTVSQLTQAAGVPEPIADVLGLGLSPVAASKTPNINIGKKTKPSGLVERGFEDLKETRVISENKLNKINEKLESDFKSISDKIIKESPIGETFENLKNDPTFKQQSRELLDQAQEIADTLPGTVSTKSIKKEIADVSSKNSKGFSDNEYDKSYKKFIKESIDDIRFDKSTKGQLVEQYRKNNLALSEYFEPGASKALNRAKRDALLDNNRAIANILEKSEPKLSKVFKQGNERWTKIMDAEAVDSFINEIFKGKVDYKKLHDFFDKNGFDRVFKRSLGEKGYKDFELLIKDMLTSETPYKMLKVAKAQGLDDFVKTAFTYFIHPTIGSAKAGLDVSKYSYKQLMNSILDKPKLAITLKKSVDNLKKGKFQESEKGFKELEKNINQNS